MHRLTLAYTNVSIGADMRNPWSSYPGHTGMQVKDFNRAGEKAFMLKGSFDFSRLGLDGVTAYALWTHGWGAVDPAFPINEIRFIVDYGFPLL